MPDRCVADYPRRNVIPTQSLDLVPRRDDEPARRVGLDDVLLAGLDDASQDQRPPSAHRAGNPIDQLDQHPGDDVGDDERVDLTVKRTARHI